MKKVHRLRLMPLLFVLSFIQTSCIYEEDNAIEVQAHRGGAALYPENTITAMVNAVKMGVRTLELDLQITKDSQVVVSHDAYLNSTKALFPVGTRVLKHQEDSLLIFHLDYDSLSRFDVGTLADPRYPRRTNISCAVPSLSELIDSVETFTRRRGIPPVNYNIEIKSSCDDEGKRVPDYQTFCDLSMQVLAAKHLGGRWCVESFDARTLNYLHRVYPKVKLSYLVEEKGCRVSDFLRELDFVPEMISPLHSIVDRKFVTDAHELQMKVIPWTVDKKNQVLRLNDLGVDGIITNEPDSVQTWLYEANRNLIFKKVIRRLKKCMDV